MGALGWIWARLRFRVTHAVPLTFQPFYMFFYIFSKAVFYKYAKNEFFLRVKIKEKRFFGLLFPMNFNSTSVFPNLEASI